jgi:hypothetical protein
MKSIVPANWLPEPAVRLALHRRKTRTTRDKSRSVYQNDPRSLRNPIALDFFSWPVSLCGARPVSMGYESGTSQPVFFLKPVAISAGRLAHQPPTLDGVVQTGPVEMAVYSLTGNVRSPFHDEPAQDRSRERQLLLLSSSSQNKSMEG